MNNVRQRHFVVLYLTEGKNMINSITNKQETTITLGSWLRSICSNLCYTEHRGARVFFKLQRVAPSVRVHCDSLFRGSVWVLGSTNAGSIPALQVRFLPPHFFLLNSLAQLIETIFGGIIMTKITLTQYIKDIAQDHNIETSSNHFKRLRRAFTKQLQRNDVWQHAHFDENNAKSFDVEDFR